VGLTVLVLGGTREARELAQACASLPGLRTVSSLAGRTSDPLPLPGLVRVGGFGGVRGLAAYLRSERVGAMIDATHPFAARISGNAAAAAEATGVALLALRRPNWTPEPGDDWRRVPSLQAAAALLPQVGTRVFLTTGRQGIGAFAQLDGCWFLARSVEPPEPPMPRNLAVLLDRGPFTADGERELLRRHRIEVLVTKDSGGPAAKLAAARALGVPVIVVDRPPAPAVSTTASVQDAVDWILSKLSSR
jgi:precorrin-6A/cobalt-precorrin-6A reductase